MKKETSFDSVKFNSLDSRLKKLEDDSRETKDAIKEILKILQPISKSNSNAGHLQRSRSRSAPLGKTPGGTRQDTNTTAPAE